MARITRMQDFSDGTVTPDRLHNLMQSATMTGLVSDDISDGRLIHIESPGSPVDGDIRVGSDGFWEVRHDGSWNAAGVSMATTMYFQNTGSITVTAGHVARLDEDNYLGIRTEKSTDGLDSGLKARAGVILNTTSPTNTATVQFLGPAVVWVTYESPEIVRAGRYLQNILPTPRQDNVGNTFFTEEGADAENVGGVTNLCFLMEDLAASPSVTLTVTAWAFFWR